MEKHSKVQASPTPANQCRVTEGYPSCSLTCSDTESGWYECSSWLSLEIFAFTSSSRPFPLKTDDMKGESSERWKGYFQRPCGSVNILIWHASVILLLPFPLLFSTRFLLFCLAFVKRFMNIEWTTETPLKPHSLSSSIKQSQMRDHFQNASFHWLTIGSLRPGDPSAPVPGFGGQTWLGPLVPFDAGSSIKTAFRSDERWPMKWRFWISIHRLFLYINGTEIDVSFPWWLNLHRIVGTSAIEPTINEIRK